MRCAQVAAPARGDKWIKAESGQKYAGGAGEGLWA